jgi:hypothetical protein
MAKILEGAKVDPSSGCQHILRGETKEKVHGKKVDPAKEHGSREVTPELMVLVKANMALLFFSRLSLGNSTWEEEEEENPKSN